MNDLGFFPSTNSPFNGEAFISQTLISRSGERLTILSVEGGSLEDLTILTDNGKSYQLIVAYERGFLHFENDDLNQILQNHLEEKEEEEERIEKKNEETLKRINEQWDWVRGERIDAIAKFRGDYEFLSNFYNCPITYKGFTYRNGEAAFQAQKDLSRSGEFTSLTPGSAKYLGKRVKLRPDWEKVKNGIMKEIIWCKFTQNPDLKEKLLGTGDRLLIEGNTWNDIYWGICDGKGQNHLGRILMEIREELRD